MKHKHARWIRTCQECGYKQESKPIADWKSDKWKDVKCKKCKSEGLDYGSWIDYRLEEKIWGWEEDDENQT